MHRLWPNDLVPGQLAQELPVPALFEQVSQLVTKEMVAGSPTPCGPDLGRHVDAIMTYVDAGFDEVYVTQVGQDQEGFFDVYREAVLPRVRSAAGPSE